MSLIPDNTLIARLDKWYLNKLEKMITLTRKLVNAESPTHVPQSHQRIRRLLIRELEKCDFICKEVSGPTGRKHLLARPLQEQPVRRFQLIIGHFDTVWPLRTLSFKDSEGRLYGPGIFDMKAGLVQLIFALRALRDLRLTPPCPPVIFLNSDEETGSADSVSTITRLAKKACRAYVLEPAAGKEGKLKTARKGVAKFHVKITGKASHAGLAPEEGANAILELAHQLVRIAQLQHLERGITVNIGTIEGGLQTNVVADQAGAWIEARVFHHSDVDYIEKNMAALTPVLKNTIIEVTGKFTRPPMEFNDANKALFNAAKQAAQGIGMNLDYTVVGGSSDGSTTSLYTPTLDGLGAVGGGAHAMDEHIVTATLIERSKLLALLLLLPEQL